MLATLRRLEEWGRERDWLGPDPYEGMNAERLGVLKRSALGRRLLIQATKRSPVDLRPALGIVSMPSAAALAHVLRAYARMVRAHILAADEGGERLRDLSRRLDRLRVGGFSEPCWGYPFDVETRFFFYPSSTPNTIATAFAGLALLDADAVSKDPSALRLAEGAGDFFVRHIPQTVRGEGAFFGYLPGDRTPIHNANLLASSFLALLAQRTGRREFEQAARAGLRYALEHQRADGSWPYAEDARGRWVDNLHTGYVLDGLLRCARSLREPDAEDAYLRGLTFYSERLFEADHAPKYLADRLHPIDGQCIAQAIQTFSLAAEVDPACLQRASGVYEFAVERMQRADGAFAFQRRRLWVNRTPHIRWVQAPMLDALSGLYEALAAPGAGRTE